jgi:hypothetical protein
MGTLAPHQSRAQERVAIENSLLRRYAKGRKPIPEALIEAAALESCRFMRNEHCGTFFALWSLYYPQSPALKGALKAKRQQGSPASKYLTQQSLAGLRVLFGSQELNEGKRFTAGEAERLTGRFRRHYFHVVPFRRDRLDEIWDRCHEADCEERRRKAEVQIGISDRNPGARADRGLRR